MNRPTISDFGGDAYKKGGKYQKMNANTSTSFRCLDCDKISFFTPTQLSRAAIAHCLHCGGTIQETPSNLKKRNRKTKKTKDKFATEKREQKEQMVQCECCAKDWKDVSAFAFHLSTKPECRVAYEISQQVVNIDDEIFIKPTLHVIGNTNDGFELWGTDRKGKFGMIKCFKRKHEADNYLS